MKDLKEKLLIVVTPDSPMEKVNSVIENWIEEGVEDKELELVMFIDDELPQTVSSWLMYVAFLGGKIESEMKRAILNELRERGRELLQEEEGKLMNTNLSYHLKERIGDVEEVLIEEINNFKPNRVMVNGIDVSKLADMDLEVIE